MTGCGIFAYFGYDLPLEESLRRIAAAGFDTVSLFWGAFDGGPPLHQQPDLARRVGLRVENAHAPFDGVNALWTPGDGGDRAAASLIEALEGCAASGVPVLVAHLTDGPAPPPPSLLGIDRLKQVEAAAERCRVVLALENLRHAAHLHAALSALTSPFTRFCYDSGHHFGWGRGEPYLERYGARLAALHLHDNDGTKDQHLLPFDGAVDWPALMGRLSASGYDGALTLEVQAAGRYESAMPASAFLERARAALERLYKCQTPRR